MGNQKVKEEVRDLSEIELCLLSKKSGYSIKQIILYYKSFLIDCPNGKLTKKQFRQMYKQYYPNSKSHKFCDRIFETFDENGDDSMDFYEFLNALQMTTSSDIKEKLKCAFKIYDLNNDGKLDKKEMRKILHHIFEMVGEEGFKYHKGRAIDKKVDYIFEKFDVDKDNLLSLEEFVQGCLNDEYLNQMLKLGYETQAQKNQELNNLNLKINDINNNNIKLSI